MDNKTAAETFLQLVSSGKIQEGTIVELWDLGQPIEPNSPNKYGLF
ncbi:hypothetical protein [Altibacter sp. HG106]|nr:hypothetical protein [Altibacter sp. HG106]MDC7995662.1 hypothetical protein [Altibacter sp. HG106]